MEVDDGSSLDKTEIRRIILRLVSIHHCHPGMVIAKTIYTEQGLVLIAKGTMLTERIINLLKKRNISFLYVEDDRLKDIEVTDSIPVELRVEALNAINEVYEQISMENSKKSRVFDGVSIEKLKLALKDLMKEIKSKNNVINLLADMFSYDSYTFSHSTNVTLYTIAMAIQLDFSEKQLMEIGIGSMLHDIGKRKIPKEILHKKGKLTQEEYEILKLHTEYGFHILRNEPSISLLSAHCALQHHEKIDGSGYPQGLKGDEIHYYSKILAVADVFDALTSDRPYRKALLPHEAMEVLYAETYTHFDPKYVKVFQQSVATYPVGITVTLNTGETGVVVAYHKNFPNRPTVRVITDEKGNSLENPYDLELLKYPSIVIADCETILK